MSVGICYAGILRSHSAGGTAPVRAWLPPAGCVRKRVRPIAAATVLFLVLCFQLSVRIGIIQEGYRLESFRNEALEQDQMLRQYRLQVRISDLAATLGAGRAGALGNGPEQTAASAKIALKHPAPTAE